MEIRRGALVAPTAIVIVMGAAPSASAGGAMFDLPKEFYVPGEVLRADTGVWLKSPGGRLDDGPYFAYVSPVNGRRGPRAPDDPVVTAPIHVEPRGDERYGTATVSFTVPDVPPGRYWISNCNDPCTTSLGDLVPTDFTIASDASEARLLTITTRLEERLEMLRYRVASRVLGNRRVALARRVHSLEQTLAGLEEEIAGLDRRPSQASSDTERSSSLGPLLAFVLPAAILGAVFGRRTRQTK